MIDLTKKCVNCDARLVIIGGKSTSVVAKTFH